MSLRMVLSISTFLNCISSVFLANIGDSTAFLLPRSSEFNFQSSHIQVTGLFPKTATFDYIAGLRKKSFLCVLPSETLATDNLLIVSLALILGVAAQGFINSMVSGDRGLGAFLSDGSGFNRSNFKPVDRKSKKEDNAPLSGADPLPWLKLPKLSYVEVAGQSEADKMSLLSENVARETLEALAESIREHIKKGDLESAQNAKADLEQKMEEYGFEFNNDNSAA